MIVRIRIEAEVDINPYSVAVVENNNERSPTHLLRPLLHFPLDLQTEMWSLPRNSVVETEGADFTNSIWRWQPAISTISICGSRLTD